VQFKVATSIDRFFLFPYDKYVRNAVDFLFRRKKSQCKGIASSPKTSTVMTFTYID